MRKFITDEYPVRPHTLIVLNHIDGIQTSMLLLSKSITEGIEGYNTSYQKSYPDQKWHMYPVTVAFSSLDKYNYIDMMTKMHDVILCQDTYPNWLTDYWTK
jgi:hypothetical protein